MTRPQIMTIKEIEKSLEDKYGTYADELIYILISETPKLGIDNLLRRMSNSKKDQELIKRLLIHTVTERLR